LHSFHDLRLGRWRVAWVGRENVENKKPDSGGVGLGGFRAADVFIVAGRGLYERVTIAKPSHATMRVRRLL
jgi:hypothetical protein